MKTPREIKTTVWIIYLRGRGTIVSTQKTPPTDAEIFKFGPLASSAKIPINSSQLQFIFRYKYRNGKLIRARNIA